MVNQEPLSSLLKSVRKQYAFAAEYHPYRSRGRSARLDYYSSQFIPFIMENLLAQVEKHMLGSMNLIFFLDRS